MPLSIETLRSIVAYDPETGALMFRSATPEMMASGKRGATSRANQWNGNNAGRPAFAAQNHNGYLRGIIFGHRLYAHRAAWAIVHGSWPHAIDHINGDRSDNRLKNLRAVTTQENARNMARRKPGASGCLGVGWSKVSQKWSARICIDYREIHLGVFERLEDAIFARKAAEAKHGFHENHGSFVTRLPTAAKYLLEAA